MEGLIIMSINLNDFEVVQPSTRGQRKLVISVLKNGTVNFNQKLMEKFPQREVEIRISSDAKKLLIKDQGDVIIKLPKSGSIKNPNIIQRLEKNRVKFPIYYVIDWEEDLSMWLGELFYDNPNNRTGNKNKRNL